MSQRLYKAEWEYDENGEHDTRGVEWNPLTEAPIGWPEYCEAKWGEQKPFFWPDTDRVFRSRSAAQSRVDIINGWGGRAVLVECEPVWVTVEEANRRRARERSKARLDRKRSEMLKALEDHNRNFPEDDPVKRAMAV